MSQATLSSTLGDASRPPSPPRGIYTTRSMPPGSSGQFIIAVAKRQGLWCYHACACTCSLAASAMEPHRSEQQHYLASVWLLLWPGAFGLVHFGWDYTWPIDFGNVGVGMDDGRFSGMLVVNWKKARQLNVYEKMYRNQGLLDLIGIKRISCYIGMIQWCNWTSFSFLIILFWFGKPTPVMAKRFSALHIIEMKISIPIDTFKLWTELRYTLQS